MAKEKNAPEKEVFCCPVGRLFMGLEKTSIGGPSFLKHLNSSSLELLKAVRALVNVGIDKLEKDQDKGGKKKATKVKIEK